MAEGKPSEIVTDEDISKALIKGNETGDYTELNRLLNIRATKIAAEVRAEFLELSRMRQGQIIHQRMQYTSGSEFKEYNLYEYGRADYLDKVNNIIFELKSNTNLSIVRGLSQLDKYQQGATVYVNQFVEWIKILVRY